MSKSLFAYAIFIPLLIGFTIEEVFIARPKVDKMNHELDSLHAYAYNLSAIEKTINVAYPVVSEIEAHYYAYMFTDIARKYKVDITSFPALIRIESNWNPTLVSSKRCRGLTQIAASTAEFGCNKFNIDYKEGVTEWNDIVNVIIGLDYFASRYQSKGLEYAIKSYIGGDGFNSASELNTEYIEKYTKDFMAEYKKVGYIYKGVEYELDRK